MTNERAIQCINRLISGDNNLSLQDQEALTLGAEALKREETCENKDEKYMMFKCSVCGGRSVECMMHFSYCPNCGRKVEEKE